MDVKHDDRHQETQKTEESNKTNKSNTDTKHKKYMTKACDCDIQEPLHHLYKPDTASAVQAFRGGKGYTYIHNQLTWSRIWCSSENVDQSILENF